MTMKQNEKPISTESPALDDLLDGGLRKGELICLAGPFKPVNTCYLYRAALAAAEQTKKTVLLISLCAPEEEIRATLREVCE